MAVPLDSFGLHDLLGLHLTMLNLPTLCHIETIRKFADKITSEMK